MRTPEELQRLEAVRELLATWGLIIKTSINRGWAAQAAGDARLAFRRAALQLDEEGEA